MLLDGNISVALLRSSTVGRSFSGSVIPDLLVGFAADLQHLFPFELQLFSQSADVLVERVDLVVQLSDVVLPPGDLVLQLGDPAHQLPLLRRKQQQKKAPVLKMNRCH